MGHRERDRMSRWFRYYDDALNDPKVQRLSADLFKAWVNLLCVASKSEGAIQSLSDAAFALRMPESKVAIIVTELSAAGLLDPVTGGYFEPHNWPLRQFKADVTDPTAANRMRNYRNRKRNGDRNDTVTVTPPRADTEQIQSSELRSAGEPATDPRTDLFNRGRQILEKITGGTEASCRSQIGRWLKFVDDESIHVLGAIEDAERQRVADPRAWINAALQSRGKTHAATRQNGRGPSAITAAADDLVERFSREDGGWGGTREDSPRLLPFRRGE